MIHISKAVDAVLSKEGGLPGGLLVELAGPDGSGKSTMALLAVANTQKNGGQCAYVDVEHSLNPDYASSFGVDLENLTLSNPETGEEALNSVYEYCNAGYALVIVDSVAGLVTQRMLEGEAGDAHMAEVARLLAMELPKIVQRAAKNKTTIIFINQVRAKISTGWGGGGETETTFGGFALKHFCGIRLDIRRVSWLKYSTKVVGFKSRVRAKKNRYAPPYRDAFLNVKFDPEAPAIDLKESLIEEGKITKLGGKYRYKGKAYSSQELNEVLAKEEL